MPRKRRSCAVDVIEYAIVAIGFSPNAIDKKRIADCSNVKSANTSPLVGARSRYIDRDTHIAIAFGGFHAAGRGIRPRSVVRVRHSR